MQVYRIFNKKNKKSYIGITKWDFSKRYNGGKWWKWTHSPHLKRAVKKYGLDNFDYEILNETCRDEEELSNLEKMYINQYNSYIPNGYNLTTGGGSISPTHIKEYELIDEFGTIYQIKNLSEFCQKNHLKYGAMLNMVCGINVSSQGFALSSSPIESIKGINQEFEIEEIKTKKIYAIKRKDLAEFAKKHRIKRNSIFQLVNEKIYITSGFKLRKTKLGGHIRENRTIFDNLRLLDEQGKLITVNNIYQFCKERKFSRGAFYKLIKGKSLQAYGFRLASKTKAQFSEEKQLKLGKVYRIKVKSSGKIIELKNASKFCRDNNINRNSFQSLLNGSLKEYKGYILI